MAHLDGAVGHRIGDLQSGHDLARREDLDLELAVGDGGDRFRQMGAGAVERLQRLRIARRQAPGHGRRALGDRRRRDSGRGAEAGALQEQSALHGMSFPAVVSYGAVCGVTAAWHGASAGDNERRRMTARRSGTRGSEACALLHQLDHDRQQAVGGRRDAKPLAGPHHIAVEMVDLGTLAAGEILRRRGRLRRHGRGERQDGVDDLGPMAMPAACATARHSATMSAMLSRTPSTAIIRP